MESFLRFGEQTSPIIRTRPTLRRGRRAVLAGRSPGAARDRRREREEGEKGISASFF